MKLKCKTNKGDLNIKSRETMEVAGSILPVEMIKITDRALQGKVIKITEKILEFQEKLSALFVKLQVTLKPNALVDTVSRKTRQD